MGMAGIAQYKQLRTETALVDSDPHQLISMLLEGAVERINAAKGHIDRADHASKGEAIGAAISIVGGLQGCLNMEAGGDVARNLDMLYDYIARRLAEATSQNSVEALNEVGGLLGEIRSGWEGIRPEVAGA